MKIFQKQYPAQTKHVHRFREVSASISENSKIPPELTNIKPEDIDAIQSVPLLKKGMYNSPAVAAWQRILNIVLNEEVPVDSDFGSTTERRTQRAQVKLAKIFKLDGDANNKVDADGMVEKEMQAILTCVEKAGTSQELTALSEGIKITLPTITPPAATENVPEKTASTETIRARQALLGKDYKEFQKWSGNPNGKVGFRTRENIANSLNLYTKSAFQGSDPQNKILYDLLMKKDPKEIRTLVKDNTPKIEHIKAKGHAAYLAQNGITKKREVNVENVKPRVLKGLVALKKRYRLSDLLITSGNDGKHSRGSGHYTGDKVDIRTSGGGGSAGGMALAKIMKTEWTRSKKTYRGDAICSTKIGGYTYRAIVGTHGSGPHIDLRVS